MRIRSRRFRVWWRQVLPQLTIPVVQSSWFQRQDVLGPTSCRRTAYVFLTSQSAFRGDLELSGSETSLDCSRREVTLAWPYSIRVVAERPTLVFVACMRAGSYRRRHWAKRRNHLKTLPYSWTATRIHMERMPELPHEGVREIWDACKPDHG